MYLYLHTDLNITPPSKVVKRQSTKGHAAASREQWGQGSCSRHAERFFVRSLHSDLPPSFLLSKLGFRMIYDLTMTARL